MKNSNPKASKPDQLKAVSVMLFTTLSIVIENKYSETEWEAMLGEEQRSALDEIIEVFADSEDEAKEFRKAYVLYHPQGMQILMSNAWSTWVERGE